MTTCEKRLLRDLLCDVANAGYAGHKQLFSVGYGSLYFTWTVKDCSPVYFYVDNSVHILLFMRECHGPSAGPQTWQLSCSGTTGSMRVVEQLEFLFVLRVLPGVPLSSTCRQIRRQ